LLGTGVFVVLSTVSASAVVLESYSSNCAGSKNVFSLSQIFQSKDFRNLCVKDLTETPTF
jgi:hypothetical protein